MLKDLGQEDLAATAKFQNTLIFRNHREATTCGLSCQPQEVGDSDCQVFAKKFLEKVLYFSMPICLYIAEKKFFSFLFHESYASTSLEKYKS